MQNSVVPARGSGWVCQKEIESGFERASIVNQHLRMTLDELAKRAFGYQFPHTELEAFCRDEHIAPADLMESFTRHIVEGYISRRFSWEDCETAVNRLNAFVLTHSKERIPDYPWEVFLAFDAGEYHPNTPDLTPDEVTRPIIDDIVKKYHAS